MYIVQFTKYVKQCTLFHYVECVLQNTDCTLLQPTVFLAAIADVSFLLALDHLARYHRALARIEIYTVLSLPIPLGPGKNLHNYQFYPFRGP